MGSPHGINMSKEEFIEYYNKANEEIKNLVLELLKENPQHSEFQE